MHRLHLLKSALVSAFARALYVTGILHLLVAIRLRRCAVVLMYHRVIPRESLADVASHPGIIVETATFEEHLRFLRRHLNVVSAEQFVGAMREGRFAPRTCLITFDDGWSDNYTQAFPLLRKYGLPALVFLAAGFIGTKARFWQETMIHALVVSLQRAKGSPDALLRDLLAKVGASKADLRADDGAKVHIQEQVCRLKHVPEDARRSMLEQASRLVAADEETGGHPDGFLDWDQVREMARAGVSFGSHAFSHELLTSIGPDQVSNEIVLSKQVLEREVGDEVWSLSYPNGSQDASIRDLVCERGYRAGFGTEDGLVEASDDRFSIRRINVHQGSASTVPLLMARIAGLL